MTPKTSDRGGGVAAGETEAQGEVDLVSQPKPPSFPTLPHILGPRDPLAVSLGSWSPSSLGIVPSLPLPEVLVEWGRG